MSGPRKSSAYLSIFDDWFMLGTAMSRIADRVDEIVVVDGAYEWMAPFFRADGRDPTRSDPRMLEALAPWASKVRVVNGTWANEMEKRAAGYAACRHRYVWRVDADEFLFFNDAALNHYFASGKAVGLMEMPVVAAPGWIVSADAATQIERQPWLFDSERISARDHLAYLWLVLSPQERATLTKREPANIFQTPVAFNAHITGWRTVDVALGRARFYVLNYLRQGHPTSYAPGFRYDEATGFSPLFDATPPGAIAESLIGNSIVTGMPTMADAHLKRVPLTGEEQAIFAPYWHKFLAGLAQANESLARGWRRVAKGEGHHIDLTTDAARAPLTVDGGLQLQFGQTMATIELTLDRLLDHAPWFEHFDLPFERAQNSVRFKTRPRDQGVLREVARLRGWSAEPGQFYQLRAGAQTT